MQTRQRSKRQGEPHGSGTESETLTGSSQKKDNVPPTSIKPSARSKQRTETKVSAQSEEALKHEKSQRKRRRKEAEEDPGTDLIQDEAASEDEGPEEVSMSTAKAQDQQLEAERLSQHALAKRTLLRKKRRMLATGAGEVAEKSDQEELQANSEKDEDQSDTLPAAVIEALLRQKREETAQAIDAPSTGGQKEVGQSALNLPEEEAGIREKQAGLVKVAVLDPRPKFAPSVAAREYASQRLYGSRHKRSREMLFTVQGKQVKPAWDKGTQASRLKS